MIGAMFALVTSNTLFAPPVAATLTREIAAIVRREHLPSAALKIDVPGHGAYTFVDGDANIATRAPRTLEQPFRVASITKPFASMAILRLVDRGVLRKDDVVAKWYPDFPNAKLITVDDLLRM